VPRSRWLIDAQGRETGFPLVQPGHSAFSEVEQEGPGLHGRRRYILYDLNELYFDFGPMAAGDGDDVALLQRIEDQCGQWLAFRRDADTGSGNPNIRFIMTRAGSSCACRT
jgi:hypothetical protein